MTSDTNRDAQHQPCTPNRLGAAGRDRPYPKQHSRRDIIRLAATGAAAASAALLLPLGTAGAQDSGAEPSISIAEDLMREHGVLRRVLIVYSEAADRLRGAETGIDAAALVDATELFRDFGQQYHERTLEEGLVFPVLQQSGAESADLIDVLVAQHRRGEEVTNYILSATQGGQIGTANTEPLAEALESIVRMYRAHAAWEDTALFPALKKVLPPAEHADLTKQLEEIEHAKLGEGGFEDAVQRIASVEERLGWADLGQFTAPPPPEQT